MSEKSGWRPYEIFCFKQDRIPFPGVYTWVTETRNGDAAPVFEGTTDGYGIARDRAGNLPFLEIGHMYYLWFAKTGYTFAGPGEFVVDDLEEVNK